jgi:DNA (cytosine-5)-methyltransferase 1
LNEFPDNWTNTDMSNRRRYFMMGNALVVGVVRKLGDEISKIIENE